MLAISPLSPERVWAMRERGILIRAPLWGRIARPPKRFSFDHLHARLDFAARNQGRPVGHDLAHVGPAFAISGAARRAGQHQRNHFAREAVDGALVGAAHADAHLYFRRIGILWARPRRRAVAGVHAKIFRVNFVEAQPELIEALARDADRKST